MARQADSADAPCIARMLHDFNLEFGDPSPGVAFLSRRIAGLIEDGSKDYLLASPAEDGVHTEPVAFAQVDFRPAVLWDAPVAMLEELYVRPASRGHGLGRELMDSVLDLARMRGAAMAELVTGEDDTAARGLYESSGFINRVEGEGEARALYYELEL